MTTPTTTDWRGVGAEEVDELPDRIGVLLRARSRRLLRSLLRPHRRALWTLVGLVVVQNSAAMAGPWLVGVGIDRGIPALRAGDWGPLVTVVAALGGCAAVDGVLRTVFLFRTGRIGQDVLFDLRRRVFDHSNFCPPISNGNDSILPRTSSPDARRMRDASRSS